MNDPAEAAAERALVSTRGHGHSTVCELAAAREALKPIRLSVRLRDEGLITDRQFADAVSAAVRVTEELS